MEEVEAQRQEIEARTRKSGFGKQDSQPKMEDQYDAEQIDYLDIHKPKTRKAKIAPYGQLPDSSVRSSSEHSVQQSMPVKDTS